MDNKVENESEPRIAIAAAGAVVLAAVVAIVLAGGSSESKARPAPGNCVELWNASTSALTAGYHNYNGHSYTEAEVVRLSSSVGPAQHGECAVVFPSATLDPENAVAAKIYRDGRWIALDSLDGVTPVRLSELQAEAVEGANVALRPDGTLEPFSGGGGG